MTRLLAVLVAVLLPSLVAAQPNVTGVSGSTAHGGTLTITGTGFGSKSPAAPLIWVDAETGSASQHWSKIWPTTASNSVNNMAYRTTFHDVAQVHARSTRYAVGCHVDVNTATGGNIVALSFNYTKDHSKPTYLNYKFRVDPNWTDDGDDQNFKLWWANADSDPAMVEPYYYLEIINSTFTGAKAGSLGINVFDSGNMGYRCNSATVGSCSGGGIIAYGGGSVPNIATTWAQWEHFTVWSNGSSGRYQVAVNGSMKLDTTGPTDQASGSGRSESIGSYARARHANNCRYYDDLYVDRTFARVVLGNNASYSASTVREPQPPTAWSDTEITVTVNAGSFADEDTAYVFVCNTSNQCDSTGYEITIGGEGGGDPDPTVPDPPIIGTATAGNGQCTVSFTPPEDDGGDAIISYTATSNPEGKTASGASSPLTVTGLTNGQSYTFTVVATNGVGDSDPSEASNSCTPLAPSSLPIRIRLKGGDVALLFLGCVSAWHLRRRRPDTRRTA